MIQTYLDTIFHRPDSAAVHPGCFKLLKKNTNVNWIIIGIHDHWPGAWPDGDLLVAASFKTMFTRPSVPKVRSGRACVGFKAMYTLSAPIRVDDS